MTAMVAQQARGFGNLPLMVAAIAPALPSQAYQAPGSNVVAVDFARSKSVMRQKASDQSTPAITAEWREIASKRLAALHSLEAGWDGVGSVPISETAIAKADRLLDLAFNDVPFPAPPSAVPCADGSLQLEWWLSDLRVELAIEDAGEVELWVQNRSTGREYTALGAEALTLLLRWSKQLTADKLAVLA